MADMRAPQNDMLVFTDKKQQVFGEADVRIINRYIAELVSGQAFALCAASDRSRRGYQPPLRRHSYSHAVGVLAQMADRSDALAQVARACIGAINLYGTDGEESAHVYEAAMRCIQHGYDDVIGRAGPEAGRPSSHHRAFTLNECVLIDVWLHAATAPWDTGVPGIGWCLDAVIRALGLEFEVLRIKIERA